MSTLQTFRRHRKPLGGALAVLMAAWQIGQPLQAAPNDWDGSTDNAWGDATNWSVGVPTATDNLFFGLGLPNRNIILGAGSLADSLSFLDNYSLSTNDLTLTSGNVQVGQGYEATVGSQLSGSNGLTLTGGGTLRLTNASNNYTGTTTIRNGNLVINSAGALGGTGTVSVLTTNNVPGSTALVGFGGGSLVLDGTTTGFTLSRDVNVDGRGRGNNGAGILSLGNNTLSGTIATAVNSLSPVTFRNSRLSSANGTLTLSGTANMGGTTGTTFTVLGGINSAGVGNIDITGVLAGTGSIEKAGAGTLFLNPSSASGFTGTVRLSSSATGQQSSIRVTQVGAFGTNTGTAGSSGIDLNGGVLEFRSDGNLDFGALAGGKNVRLRASSTIYTGPAAGGSAINGTTTLGTFRLDANQNPTFVSRNGFGVTLGTWAQESTNNPNTITTSMGGTLRFTGNAWNNDDAAARTLTIASTGNTTIVGSITAATTSGNKGLTKSGSGLLTIIGTGTTLPGGTVAIQQGSIAVTDFRSIAASGTAATSIASLNLGSSQNQGNLIIGTTTTPTAAGLTTSKVLSLVGTTGGGAIIANQTGANPVIFNAAAVTVTGTSANGGAKTLTLGGVNTADNIINSNIPNGPVSDATTLAAATSTASLSVSLNSVAGLIVGSTITLPNSGGTRTITAIDPLTRVVTIDTVPAAGTSSGTVTGAGLVAPVSITKVGGGTWALGGTAGGNTYTGATTLSNGTLKLRANAATSTVIENTAPIRFDQTNQFAGATLDFVGQASTSNVETLGQLTLTQGANTLRLTPGATGGTASLVFGALNPTIGDGGTINVLGSTLTSTVTLTGVATGLVSPHFYIGGSDFARSNSGVLVAPVYGTDATFVAAPAGATLPAGTNQNYSINGNITAAVSGTAGTLKFNGGQALTLAASQTLTIRTGAAGTDGGILATGGTSSISGGTGITTGGSGALIIRVNGSTDALTINSPLTSGTTGGWTKSGAGLLTLTSTANASTGTITINEGTVRLGAANTRLAAANATLTVRQGATLDLNGFTPGTATGQFNNNGTVTSTAGPASLTIGGTNSTGTSYGTIGGQISVIKTGTGAQSWLGDSTYTGSTTIGSTGLVTVDTLAIGGTASGIGASSSDASNLVFNGSTGGLVYQGNIIDPSTGLTLGSRSATTDRLFTLAAAATGATISSTVSNNNAITWTSTGPIVNNTTAPATLIFGGTSLGDNTFNPQLVNSSVALGVNKTGAGQWNLGNSANSYTGITRVTEGVLAFNASGALPTNSPLILGNNATSGTVQMSGTLSRTLTLAGSATAGSGTISFGGTTGGGGFASHGGALTVSLNGGAGLTWGADGFVGTGGTQSLFLNSVSSLSSVDFQNAIDLGAAVRTISVQDNTTTGADYAILSGDLTGTGGGILKAGAGVLKLTGDNAYTGNTNVEGGTIVVSSLGASSGASTSSVGAGNVTMDNNNAIVLGNATTTGGILQYVGPGETSDRFIRIRGTSASSQIHADGSGPLILTEVRHDTTETGNKTLNLRGSNTGGNQITSALTDNGLGVLTVTVDGGATWILTNPGNTFTGNLNATAGALGIGDNAAVGDSVTGVIVNGNGNIFAYGGDRSISRALTLSNNTTNGWMGDYSLTFNAVTNLGASANNVTTSNNIAAGEALTLNGVTANALTANRAWTIDGIGETIINGDFTTSTLFGVRLDVVGDGTLNLGTNGATSNWNQGFTAVDVDRGTLKFSVNNAIRSGVGFGGLVLSPEGITSDTATVQLNGTNQAVSLLTATSSGTSIIDNNSLTPVTLTFGADNTSSAFGTGGTGTYSITQSGGGAISLTKTGTGTYNFTGNLGNTGTVTSSGGVLNINSASLATAAVGDGGTVNFKGGFTTPGNLTSVTADNGGLVSFADGVGTPFNNLATLNLSLTANSGLELDAGDSGTDTLTTLLASVANTTTLFIKDIDLSNLTTYDLILAPGGLGTLSNYSLNLPGYTGSTLSVTSTAVRLNVGTLVTTDVYWNNGTGVGGGTLTSAWNTVDGTTTNINFSSDFGGLTTLTTNASLPGKGQKVIFQGDNITGGAPLATTLEQGFTVNALEFRASTTPADTSRTISIAPGAVASNSLTIKPSASTDGINLLTGGVGSVTISAPLVAGLDQTWTVADAPVELLTVTSSAASNTLTVSSTAGLRPGMAITGPGIPAGTTIVSLSGGTTVTLSGTATATSTAANLLANQQLNVTGSLSGAGDVVKAGLGTVVISGVNANLTGTYTNNAGLTQVTTLSGLGGQVGVPGSGTDITVSGGIFALNAASSTFVNDITLNGGTLSGGTGNHTYSGAVAVNADSTINMRDLGQSIAISSTTARNITLSGVVTGTSAITIDSVDVANGGNRLNGNVVFNNSANTWSGDLNLTRGSVFFQNVAGSGNATPYAEFTGDINFNQYGRVVYRNLDAQTLNRTGTLSVAGSAIGELSADNVDTLLATNYVVNQQGQVSLNANSALRLSVDDGSAINLTGGVVLNGNASITVQGSAQADNLVTISGTGISGTGNLALNDELGGWGVTSRAIRIDAAGTYIGNTTLTEGTLILGIKDALSTGSLTITGTGAAILQAGINLTGSNAVANATTLSGNLTVSGSNSLELTGAFTGMGTDAARTLTNSLTGGATLAISGTSTNMNLASVASTSPRVLTIAGAGNTSISQVINNGNSQANGITKTGSGTLTLSNTNLYTGTTTLSSAAATNNGIILATASNALGTGNFTSVMSDGVTSIGQLQLSGGITLANSFTTSGVGSDGTDSGIIRSISGDNIISGLVNLTGGGGASTYRADTGASLTFTNTIGAVGGQTDRIINLVGGGDFVFDNVIRNFNDGNAAGTTGLNSSNTGTTTLNALNIYTRATTVGAGSTLIAGSTQAFGIGSAATVTGTLRLAGNNNSIGSITGAGTIENANAAAATLTVGTNNTSTNFSGGIQDGTGGGALALTKTGSGTTTLSGTNTYTGQTTISAGILAVSGGSAIANTGTVQIDDVAGATLRLDSNETIGVLSGGGATGGVLNLQANTLTVGSGTFSGAINGTGGGLTKTGTGTLLLDGGVANGFTGVTTVSAGNLNLSRSTTNSTILGNVTIDGGTLNILSNEQIANTSIITQTSGAFRLNGRTETIGTYNKSGGTFSTGIGGKLFLLGNTWTENGGVSTVDAEGAINDANVNILNGGTIEVYGSNNASYSPGPFGTFGGELQVVTGGTGLNFGAGSNAVNLDSDATAADVGKLVLSSSITTTGAGSSLITSVGAGAVKGIVDLNAGTRTIDTGASNNLTVSAVITNGGITKEGAGSLILTEANTYNLGTQVNTGTLLVNNTTGSGTGTGNVTIDAGATLGGSGIIAPTVNDASVSVQGLLNVGNAGTGEDLVIDMSGATGTLVIDLTGGVTLDYFSGQGTGVLNTGLSFNDQLGIVGGGATLNLGGDLTFNNFNGLAANTFTAGSSWKLFAWSGVTTSGAFSNITGTIGNFTGFTDLSGELLGWDFTNLYTTGIVSIVAIPEPSRAMLLLLGLLSLGFRRRRNRF